MSDENEPSLPDETEATDAAPQPEPAAEATVRRTGSAAAAAATRARRIGGRPVAPSTGTEKTTDEPVGDEPTVVLSKSTLPLPPDDALGPFAATARPRSGSSVTLVRWIPAAVLGVAALVMAIVVAVSTHGVNWARSNSNAQRDQVLAAAKSCVVATNTYSYKDLDAFEKKGLACATGSFATQFKSSVDKILRKGAPPVKQVQSLQINTAGLVSVSKSNEWQVLVYGQISVTNTTTTAARIDPFGAVATMKKVGGSWRLTTLCSQSLGGTTDSCY